VREEKDILRWVREQYADDGEFVLDGPKVWQQVAQPRVHELKAGKKWIDKGDGKEGWKDFQFACDHLPDRALLLFSCNSGKTLAAWRWIATQATRQPVSRVLFLYPTRATDKEGCRDYVSWAPEAALMHGTAEFDLKEMFDNEAHPRHGLSYIAERRLFALGYWPKQVFSATVDQFLAFLQHGYGSTCMLPVLTDLADSSNPDIGRVSSAMTRKRERPRPRGCGLLRSG
jgi:CRISPR-associated endonuclease/helicase Cas3